jgi:hypothetical protein
MTINSNTTTTTKTFFDTFQPSVGSFMWFQQPASVGAEQQHEHSHHHQQQQPDTIVASRIVHSGDVQDDNDGDKEEKVVQMIDDGSDDDNNSPMEEDCDFIVNNNNEEGEVLSLLPSFPQKRSTSLTVSSSSALSTSTRGGFFSNRRRPFQVDACVTSDSSPPSSLLLLMSCWYSTGHQQLNILLHTHWLGRGGVDDNNPWTMGSNGTLLLDSSTIKLFKFCMVSIQALLVVHGYAWMVHDKRDVTYGIKQMVLYDSSHIALDMIVFFVVGRLYQQPSVDRLIWIGPAIISAFLQSMVATHFTSLQHSITPYEIHCAWSWQMWILIFLGGIPLFGTIIGAHVVGSYRRGVAIPKLIELVVTLIVFVTPYMGSPFFHLHHWYYDWFIGMHCNLDVWYSRLSMGVMWGVYLNGIAIFGRDPIMTCAVTLYQSQNQECSYLSTLNDGIQDVLHNYTVDDLARDSGADWTEEGCDMTPAR